TGLSKSKEVRSLIDIEDEKWLLTSLKSEVGEIEDKEESKEIVKKLALDEVCVSKMEVNVKEDEDLKKANKLANEAWNQKNYNKKVKLAREALEISKNCAEAYIILSYDNSLNIKEQKALVIKGIEAA
ncbi:hypothetical protein GNF66_15695, partial [Clostridium perfringens]|nr:hypothetical protein [Clostridium perfringens]